MLYKCLVMDVEGLHVKFTLTCAVLISYKLQTTKLTFWQRSTASLTLTSTKIVCCILPSPAYYMYKVASIHRSHVQLT